MLLKLYLVMLVLTVLVTAGYSRLGMQLVHLVTVLVISHALTVNTYETSLCSVSTVSLICCYIDINVGIVAVPKEPMRGLRMAVQLQSTP